MRGVFNGYSINGASLPGWLVRAALVSAASAVAIATPTRTTFASAFGDASVEVTLTSEHTLAARAIGVTDSSSSASASVVFAGASLSNADAIGFASVIRYITAEADGDGTAYGDANPADQLGEASGSLSSTVDLCLAHLIRPAASNVLATLEGSQADGDVTRYTGVYALASAPVGRAEASVKLSGESFFRHDGYSAPATGSASGHVDQDKMLLSAGNGSIDFGNSSAQNRCFVIYTARSQSVGEISPVLATATKTHGARVSGLASASADIHAVRTRPGQAAGLADAFGLAPRASVRHASSASGALGVDGLAVAIATRHASAIDFSGLELVESRFGIQHYAGLTTEAIATGQLGAIVKYASSSLGSAVSDGYATGVANRLAYVTAVAESFSGLAYALSNADNPAPTERTAVVQYESRGIEVPYENRTVVA